MLIVDQPGADKDPQLVQVTQDKQLNGRFGRARVEILTCLIEEGVGNSGISGEMVRRRR